MDVHDYTALRLLRNALRQSHNDRHGRLKGKRKRPYDTLEREPEQLDNGPGGAGQLLAIGLLGVELAAEAAGLAFQIELEDLEPAALLLVLLLLLVLVLARAKDLVGKSALDPGGDRPGGGRGVPQVHGWGRRELLDEHVLLVDVGHEQQRRGRHVQHVVALDAAGDEGVELHPPLAGTVARQPPQVLRRLDVLDGVLGAAPRRVPLHRDAERRRHGRVHEEVVGAVLVPYEPRALALRGRHGRDVVRPVHGHLSRRARVQQRHEPVVRPQPPRWLLERRRYRLLPRLLTLGLADRPQQPRRVPRQRRRVHLLARLARVVPAERHVRRRRRRVDAHVVERLLRPRRQCVDGRVLLWDQPHAERPPFEARRLPSVRGLPIVPELLGRVHGRDQRWFVLPPRPRLGRSRAHRTPYGTADWWAPGFYLLRHVGLPADDCPRYVGWTCLSGVVVLLIEC